jgi:hypothetical protein
VELEKVPLPLQGVGKELFRLMRDLAGGEHGLPVRQNSGWWRAPREGKVCLYLYFLGNRANAEQPNSVRLTALMDGKLAELPWVEPGNNWFGSTSADYYLRPDDPQAMERAEHFIRHAYRAIASKVVSDVVQDDKTRAELEKDIEAVATNAPHAPAAAARIRQAFAKLGVVTTGMIRDVLVNVASEVAKKALLGP